MANVIKLKKGLNINLEGTPEEKFVSVKEAKKVTLVPDDFVMCTPKIVLKAGDAVKAGDEVFHDKQYPEIKFVSPVSGTLEEVVRGDRRKVLGIVISNDGKDTSAKLPIVDPKTATVDEVKQAMLDGGVWPFLTQRPYGVLANPSLRPRDIFVTALNTAPLAPSFDLIVKGQEADFETGLAALAKLSAGKVYVGAAASTAIPAVAGVEKVTVEGPHPAGNVGVQINNFKPINKGEIVWTANAQDVIVIGRILNGKCDFKRIISIAGSEVVAPAYAKVQAGQSLADILDGKVKHVEYKQRVINGDVLTGVATGLAGSLNFKGQTITVIPEGDTTDEIFGWITPGLTRYSTSNTGLAGLFGLFKSKKWKLDARLKGGPRALIVSGDWERVFPMDIYPEHLYKAVLAYDIDKMEQLGIYEVLPEDFALCEFVDVSKNPVQQVIADGLVKLRKEME
ncbi:MAG: Na(+)-translocating NADH-quinone reductase subunit A [Bacteroidales bacterium]|nr:Na(+)-translocating NADH-quinone reductase subunit A [Bacteroidales bacterium]